jgi:chemotaxis protein methyltransferase CheR
MSLPLSPEVFRLFASVVEEHAGLHYDLRDRELFAEKISARAIEREFPSLLDYYYFLRYDAGGAAEFDQLVDALVVNETYLFREVDQLQALVDLVLSPLVAARAGKARVWCAASSTGEEPMTLASLLRGADILERVELVASDISSRVLAKAEAGVYRGRALRALPAHAGPPTFVKQADGSVKIDPAMVSHVRWLRLNLLDRPAIELLGVFDAIICRNVLIYFDDATTTAVVGSLTEALRPGGVLLVGASESLLRFSTALVCEEQAGTFMYRKPVK